MNQLRWSQKKIAELFTDAELAPFLERSDSLGWLEIVKIWGWIIASFVMVAIYPNWFTVLLAIWIVGAKQLGCAIIMHDAGHNSLFKTRQLNQIVGNWLGAYPLLNRIENYRPYHNKHHRFTGLDQDPDTNLVRAYPTTPMSMLRKILRDLTGLSGVKFVLGLVYMGMGLIEYNLGNRIIWTKHPLRQHVRMAIENLTGPLIFHALLFGICWMAGHPKIYGIWWGAQIFVNPFILRVRSIAEHSVVRDSADPQCNSRTVIPNLLEKFLFAPLNVNYHAEHHLLISAPCYRLPAFHQALMEKGYFTNGSFEPNGYKAVLVAAMTPKSA